MADHVGDRDDAVAHNRSSIGRSVGATGGLVVLRAEHGAAVHVIDAGGEVPLGDGLVTDVPGLGLAALGADCAIVGLQGERDDGSLVIGALHCGWRGIVADVVGAVVSELHDQGVGRLRSVLGPAICGHCYSVPFERCEQIMDTCPPDVTEAAIKRMSSGWGIDVGAAVHARLAMLGAEVDFVAGCSFESDRWFSLRRAVTMFGPNAATGRQALALVIE